MTKIEIDMSEYDYTGIGNIKPTSILEQKCIEAYEKKIENEIKVGDWVYNEKSKAAFVVFENEGFYNNEPCFHKLPKELQEPMKKWIEELK